MRNRSRSDGERDVRPEAFSRGFSEAYLVGERGNEMMSYRRPEQPRLLVGRVRRPREGRATVTLESELDEADTIRVLDVERQIRAGRWPT